MQKAKNVEEILNLNGEEFVRALYQTLLNRDPDTESLNAAVQGIAGGGDKRDFLISTALSDEARGKAWPLDGLPQLLAEAKRERIPVVGFIFRFKALLSRMLRQINKSENRLAYIESQLAYRLVKIESDVNNLHNLFNAAHSETSHSVSAQRAEILEAISKHLQTTESFAETTNGGFSEMWLKLNHISYLIDSVLIKKITESSDSDVTSGMDFEFIKESINAETPSDRLSASSDDVKLVFKKLNF